jgi:DNA-binding XRE family transcriptional regulator
MGLGGFSPSLHLALRICDYFEVPVEVVFSLSLFPRLGTDSVSRSA